jgi:hypothetical protein
MAEEIKDVVEEPEVVEAAEAEVSPETMAARLGQLSEVVAEAGIVDVAEGAAMLATSDDIKGISAAVGLMGAEDLESGLEVARTAGELWAASDVVDLLEMPVLAAFLESRGELLQNVAVEIILRASGTRALSQVLTGAGEAVADLGDQEVAEGLVRAVASQVLAEESDELAAMTGEAEAAAGAE